MARDRHKVLAAVLGVPDGHLEQPYIHPLNLGLPELRQIPNGRGFGTTGSLLLTLVLGFAVMTGVLAGLLTEVKLPIRVQIVVETSNKDNDEKLKPPLKDNDIPAQGKNAKPNPPPANTGPLAISNVK